MLYAIEHAEDMAKRGQRFSYRVTYTTPVSEGAIPCMSQDEAEMKAWGLAEHVARRGVDAEYRVVRVAGDGTRHLERVFSTADFMAPEDREDGLR